MLVKIQLILPPVTSNRVVLILIRPGSTSLEVVLVQMSFNEVHQWLMERGKQNLRQTYYYINKH